MTETPTVARPYADSVVDYAQAGWPAILPVPPRDKFPPPVGFTGAEGRDTDPLQLVAWASTLPEHAVALRMPDGVIGIDVDQYEKKGVQKRGAETLAACIERWGPLPATWTSTSRDPGGPSRIYLFRAPAQRYATRLMGEGTGDVEIIQRHHRYAVVWPSTHSTGWVYRWYAPDGSLSAKPPRPDDLAELPPRWVEGLRDAATDGQPVSADHASGHTLLGQLLDDWRPECADLTSARLTAVDVINRTEAGSRHDVMVERTYPLIQLAAHGHPGVAAAVMEVRELWAKVTAGEDRAQEFEDALLGAARKAATIVGSHQVPRDPCLMVQGFPMPLPAAQAALEGTEPGADLTIVEAPRWVGVRELIGTHAFDPMAGLDQTLAEAVLARTYPALRYAYDTRGWLLRQPERWELHGDLASWAVSQVAALMPVGDATADKKSEAYARHLRRTRLMTNAGGKAVSAKMGDLVAGGLHPASAALGTLDSDPELLWAGGHAWSLRDSLERPTPAEIDPTTPHLHSAAVAPQRVPTPLWDAFTAAVWPDEETRRWALRVLAVCLTGYPDRALPILLGETGRGKTQVVTLLMSVLGSYAHAANPKLLLSNANVHDSIVFALKGRRMSFIDEGPSERKAGQERLKQLTGGGELTANAMHKDPVTFRPTHTLVLTANDEPVLTDPAVRARVRLLPCHGDPDAVGRARAAIGSLRGPAWRREAPGVLAAMMSEAAGWLLEPATGSTAAAPETIRYLAESLAVEQDPTATWLAEETEPWEAGTASRELYQAFRVSCQASGIARDQVPSETRWGRELTRHGYPSFHTEHGKRKALRIRFGGSPDGLRPSTDGFLTGLNSNPSVVFPQVNHSVSTLPDQSDGYNHIPPLISENTPLSDIRGETPETPKPVRPVSPDEPPAKPKRSQSPEAKVKAAETREAKRLEAIAAAAGAQVRLPAVVTRDGAVRPISTADAHALLATITGTGDGALTVDVEHSGYPLGHVDYALRTVQLGNEHFAVVLDPDDTDQHHVGRLHLLEAEVLHAHSATADLIPLADAEMIDDLDEAWTRMDDTAILAKLSDPGSVGNDADLKHLSQVILREAATSPAAEAARSELFKAGKWLTKVEVTTPVARSGWAQVDPRSETMVRYAASDVLDDAAIAKALPRPPAEQLEREHTTQRMTARVTYRGLRLDGEHIARLLPLHEEAKAGFAERVKAYGIDNPGSPAQVGSRLVELGAALPRTATGKPSAAEGALEPLRGAEGDVGALANAVLDWRHHDTALKLFLRPYDALVRHGDGRARPTVYTLGADTGRMSCVRPNLQQMPRQGGFRACITADPGELLISADFAGVELRGAAALSGDRELQAILADGRDIHAEIARLVWGPGYTKENRYQAKPMVFQRLYGGGPSGIARQNGVSIELARSVVDAMDAMMPGLAEWSRMIAGGIEAGRTKFPAYSGRIIHMPTDRPYAGGNYAIQGTCRELLVDALLRWSQTPWGNATLLPVHDELLVVVPEAEAAAATAALTECMTSELFGVPIIAEASEPTYAWSDAA